MSEFCHSPICIASFLMITIINLILIPFSIYITLKYYRFRNTQAMTRRYPDTVIILGVLNILYLLVVCNYMLILNGIVLEYAYSNYWILWIGPIIYEPWFLLILIINVFRLWLISFNINLSVCQTRQKWQSMLNEG